MPLDDVFLLLAMCALFARMVLGPNESDLSYLGVTKNDD